MECTGDDGSIDGVFQSIKGIIAKIIDRGSRDNCGGSSSRNLCVLVEHGVGIGRIISFGNRLFGDDGGDVGGEGEGVVEQRRNHGGAVSDIEDQNQVEAVRIANGSGMGSHWCWL